MKFKYIFLIAAIFYIEPSKAMQTVVADSALQAMTKHRSRLNYCSKYSCSQRRVHSNQPNNTRSTKLIISDYSALKNKYGEPGIDKINTALKKLQEKDSERGISTDIIYLNKEPELSIDSKDEKQYKKAIDNIYRERSKNGVDPYIMLLGSTDVIPHQRLSNPTGDQLDVVLGLNFINEKSKKAKYKNTKTKCNGMIDSDLPYACDDIDSENEYIPSLSTTTDIFSLSRSTRKVGRLPDITGANDPTYLVKLLDTASNYEPKDRKDYLQYFCLSNPLWKEATEESLMHCLKDFGPEHYKGMFLYLPRHWSYSSETGGYSERAFWEKQHLLHFINCHGSNKPNERSKFYGDRIIPFSDIKFTKKLQFSKTVSRLTRGSEVEIKFLLHDAELVNGHISEGTVAVVEACYGALLYEPEAGEHMSMCHTYLGNRAYGYFGSSSIVCGPPDCLPCKQPTTDDEIHLFLLQKAGLSDSLAQFFARHILYGYSLGEATLKAREDFITNYLSKEENAKRTGKLDDVKRLNYKAIARKTLIQFSLMGDPSIRCMDSY